jgi:hypothetical protein
MVEAFSLRGLGRIAESWKHDPPFPNNNAFGNAIVEYRRNIVQRYANIATTEQGLLGDPAAWFAKHRRDRISPSNNCSKWSAFRKWNAFRKENRREENPL